jgi:8-oxo-dGTP pyrophosphatase MutT (NUDIX family)
MLHTPSQHSFIPYITSAYKSTAFNSLSYKGKRGYKKAYYFTDKMIEEKEKEMEKVLMEKEIFKRKTQNIIYGAILRCRLGPETKYAVVQGRYTGKWSFPKGHSKESETPLECALRELYEETSIKISILPTEYMRIGFGNYYVFDVDREYDLVPTDTNEIMNTRWVTLQEMDKLLLNADANLWRKSDKFQK